MEAVKVLICLSCQRRGLDTSLSVLPSAALAPAARPVGVYLCVFVLGRFHLVPLHNALESRHWGRRFTVDANRNVFEV